MADEPKDIKSVYDILSVRMEAADKATVVLAENVNRVPTLLDRVADNLREMFAEKLAALGRLTDERFEGLKIAFREDKIAAATAVAAAFQAQEKLSVAQAASFATAIAKSEASTTKELESLDAKISALKETFASDVRNIEGRLNRGEGGAAGGQQARDAWHMNVGSVMGIIGGIVGVIALLFVVIGSVQHEQTLSAPLVAPLPPAQVTR